MSGTVRAGMPWAFLTLVLVFGVGVIAFRFLDPVVGELLGTAADTSSRAASKKGIATVQTIWDYWPVWFTGALFLFGYVEAVRKSSPRGVR